MIDDLQLHIFNKFYSKIEPYLGEVQGISKQQMRDEMLRLFKLTYEKPLPGHETLEDRIDFAITGMRDWLWLDMGVKQEDAMSVTDKIWPFMADLIIESINESKGEAKIITFPPKGLR
jgi:hypothetical protein